MHTRDFPIAQMVKNLPAMQETQAWSLGWEDSLEVDIATHSSMLAWRNPWTEKSGDFSSWGRKESDTTEELTLHFTSMYTVFSMVISITKNSGILISTFVVVVISLQVVPDCFATLWTLTCQAPLSMWFSRQEYWSGLPFFSPGDLPDLGSEPTSPTWQEDYLPLSNQGSPYLKFVVFSMIWSLALFSLHPTLS